MKDIFERICRVLMYLLKIDSFIGIALDLSQGKQRSRLGLRYPGAKFYGMNSISDLDKFKIGMGSNIKGAFIDSSGGVSIGDFFHSGYNLSIISSNHNYEGTHLPYGPEDLLAPVRIEHFVWVGMNVSILPGVTIGEGAVIGMGSVVTKDIPPMAIAAGNPARVIRVRDPEHFKRLKEQKLFLG